MCVCYVCVRNGRNNSCVRWHIVLIACEAEPSVLLWSTKLQEAQTKFPLAINWAQWWMFGWAVLSLVRELSKDKGACGVSGMHRTEAD